MSDRQIVLSGPAVDAIEAAMEALGVESPAELLKYALRRLPPAVPAQRWFCYVVSWLDADDQGWTVSKTHRAIGTVKAGPDDTRMDITMDVLNAAKMPPNAHLVFLSIEPDSLSS